MAMPARVAALAPLIAVPLGLYLMSPLAPLAAETEFPSPAKSCSSYCSRSRTTCCRSTSPPPARWARSCSAASPKVAAVSRRAPAWPCCWLAASIWRPHGHSRATYFLRTRFMIMLGFLLFGAVLPTGLPRSATVTAVTFFTLLFVIRIAMVGSAWLGHRDDVADMRAVIAAVEPGARVFVASVSPEEAPATGKTARSAGGCPTAIRVDYHLAALLLIERRAFWPFLFDNPSQQPVKLCRRIARWPKVPARSPTMARLQCHARSISVATITCCCSKRGASPTCRTSPRNGWCFSRRRTSPRYSASDRRVAGTDGQSSAGMLGHGIAHSCGAW